MVCVTVRCVCFAGQVRVERRAQTSRWSNRVTSRKKRRKGGHVGMKHTFSRDKESISASVSLTCRRKQGGAAHVGQHLLYGTNGTLSTRTHTRTQVCGIGQDNCASLPVNIGCGQYIQRFADVRRKHVASHAVA